MKIKAKTFSSNSLYSYYLAFVIAINETNSLRFVISMYVHVYVYMYVCVYMYLYVCVCIYVY